MKLILNNNKLNKYICEVKSIDVNPTNKLVAFSIDNDVRASKIYNCLCDCDYSPVLMDTVITVQFESLQVYE